VTAVVLAVIAVCSLSPGGHEIRGEDGRYLGRAECKGKSIEVRDSRGSHQLTIELRGRGARVVDASGRLVLEVR